MAAKIWNIAALRPITHQFGYLRDNPRKNVQSSKTIPEIIRIADGYFQEEKYITQVWRDVSFELANLLAEIYSNLRSRLSLPDEYQVIHVRRPDEKHHLISPLNIGALDNLYFKNSCEKIPTENRMLLISQKTELGDTINFIRPKFVFDSTETTAWETLAIMSFAQNLIGSNSTLSWWGARMCVSNGGNAYLPDKWSIGDNFETNKLFFSGLNLLRSSWMSGTESHY